MSLSALAMHGYGPYVWGAVGAVLAALVGEGYLLSRRVHAARLALEQRQSKVDEGRWS